MNKKINKINIDYIFWKNESPFDNYVLSCLLFFSYIVAHTLSIFIHAWDAIFPRDSRGLQTGRTKYGTRKILEHEKAGGRRAKIIRRRVRREERENVLTYVGGGESHLDGDSVILVTVKFFLSKGGTEKERSFRLKFLFHKVTRVRGNGYKTSILFSPSNDKERFFLKNGKKVDCFSLQFSYFFTHTCYFWSLIKISLWLACYHAITTCFYLFGCFIPLVYDSTRLSIISTRLKLLSRSIMILLNN